MKLKSLMLIVLIILSSCKNDKSPETVQSIDYSETELDVTTSAYPESITKVFEIKRKSTIHHWG